MGKRNLEEFRMDADYKTQINRRDGGRGSKQYPVFRCPIYLKWMGVKERAGNGSVNKNSPAYSEVDVCDDWLSFMNFRSWVLEQPEYEGLALDKDLLCYGNNVYSPEFCLFVPTEVNNALLLGSNKLKTSDMPLGVTIDKGRIVSQFYDYRTKKARKQVAGSLEDAHKIWQENRENSIRFIVTKWEGEASFNSKAAENLLAVADKLSYNRENGIETFDLSF